MMMKQLDSAAIGQAFSAARTETSGSCLGSSGDDQLEDDEMALDDNENDDSESRAA